MTDEAVRKPSTDETADPGWSPVATTIACDWCGECEWCLNYSPGARDD